MGAAVCPHCLTTLGNQEAVCPKCGGQTTFSSPVHCIPIGATIRSNRGHAYLIGKVIGDGGFGITYAAKDLSSNRIVAVKEYYPKNCSPQRQGLTIYPGTSRDAFTHGLQSFLKEATMLQAVANIPSIVHVLNYFEANNTAYVVMEYLNGKTLRRVVERSGAMSFRELLPKLRTFMSDIATLHDAGVLHRDIAPDNIMLMPDGSLRLLDFGCARSMEDGRAMTVILKPGFAPVEQYQTRGQGPCTDIYALCATIYYCVTGGKVPPGSPERQIAVAGNQPDPLLYPIALGAKMSPANEQVLLWGLSIRPENRPQKISELASRFVNEPAVSQLAPPPNPSTYHTTDGRGFNVPLPTVPNSNPPKPEPFPPQPVPQPQPTPKPANNTWKLIVGIIAAIVLVAVIAVIAISAASKDRDPVSNPNPPRNDAPTVTTPAPNGIKDAEPDKTADDGSDIENISLKDGDTFTDGYYTYKIHNGGLILTDCSDDYFQLTLPSTVDIPNSGESYNVTSIAAGAFKNLTKVNSIAFPMYLETIEDGAFDSCNNLRCAEVYTKLGGGSSPFKNCNNLRCVLYFSFDYPSGPDWLLPSKAKTYPFFMELNFTNFDGDFSDELYAACVDDNGVIYGITYNEEFALILDVPSGLKSLEVPDTVSDILGDYDVLWAYDNAFDDTDSSFDLIMSDSLYMNPNIYSKVNYSIPAGSNIEENFIWAINMEVIDRINAGRIGSIPKIEFNYDIFFAADDRAWEIANDPELYCEFVRPDGTKWSTALDETDYLWIRGSEMDGGARYMTAANVESIAADFVSGLGEAFEDGSYPTDIGIMGYLSGEDGFYYIVGISANQ